MTDEQKYPSVDLAYEITLNSYTIAFQRSDTIDAGVDRLITWATSINLALITLVFTKTPASHPMNCWLFVAATLLMMTIGWGYTAKLAGWFHILEPRVLFLEGWLKSSHWTFQKDIIDWGSQHIELNMNLVKKKAKFLGYATFSFLLEMVALGLWVLESSR